MVDAPSKRDEVVYNLAVKRLNNMDTLLVKASEHYQESDYIACFHTLKNLKYEMIPRLDQKQRDVLRTLERTMSAYFRLWKQNSQLVKGGIIRSALETYRTKIMDLLAEKGYLGPLKESSEKLYGQN